MAKKEIIEIIVRGLWRQRDRVLLCRNRQHGHVFLPGGHVEFGEPAAAALKRELREELGLELDVGPLLGVCEASFLQERQKKSGGRHHEINLLFEVHSRRQRGGAATVEPVSQEDHIEFVWVKLQDLRGPHPAVRLLPRGIVALVVKSQRANVPLA